jgi:hypothetical protein
MGDHGVAHEIGRADFDANAIVAEYRCHCVDDFEGEPTSVLDGAAVGVVSIVEVADTGISARFTAERDEYLRAKKRMDKIPSAPDSH